MACVLLSSSGDRTILDGRIRLAPRLVSAHVDADAGTAGSRTYSPGTPCQIAWYENPRSATRQRGGLGPITPPVLLDATEPTETCNRDRALHRPVPRTPKPGNTTYVACACPRCSCVRSHSLWWAEEEEARAASSSCGAASCWAYAAPPNSVRLTAVTKPTINFFAFIFLLCGPSPSGPSPSVRRPISVRARRAEIPRWLPPSSLLCWRRSRYLGCDCKAAGSNRGQAGIKFRSRSAPLCPLAGSGLVPYGRVACLDQDR